MRTFGQSTITNFKTGSLIIPMDNAKQNLTSSQVAFNVKAYGLINVLLQNNIPVNWVIKDTKSKDAIDFSVNSSRILPGSVAPANIDYKAGPFVIDSLWASTALPFITAYGNSVAVYRAETAFIAPVRYQLMFKPKIAIFTNGNSQGVHTKALRLAGFTAGAHFDSIPAQTIDASSCYTFAAEPHWSGGQSSVTSKVTLFLNGGGNFFAQCAGINAYEQFEHHHTTNGITYETTSAFQENNNLYLGVDQPLMQFEGDLTNAPTGTIVNYKNDGGSYQPLTQFLVKKTASPSSGSVDGDVVLSTRKVSSTITGGNATYLGGHDYLKGTFDLLDLGLLGLEYARANDVTWNNGLRIFYNSIFVPSTRPTSCNFVFAGEARVTSTVSDYSPCLSDTVDYKVTFMNTGPGTARNIAVKTLPTPGGLSYLSSSTNQGMFAAGTNTWTIGQLPPNTSVQLTIKYKVVNDGTYSLKAYNANLIAGNNFIEDTTIIVFTTDQSAPILVAPPALNVFTNNGCAATGVNLGTPTISDECGIASSSNNAPSTFPLGATTVTYTATDNSGNIVYATQIVTVTDNVNPSIVAPANISASANAACSATGIVLGTPTVSDNCGVASVSNNAPGSFPVGVTNVIWTVTDNSGNISSAIQTVTVVDNQNPTITAPSNINTFTNNGCTAIGLDLGNPLANDNCTISSITNNAPSVFPLGSTSVTWTVTDNSGNSASATQTITVTDNVVPSIVPPADITANVDNNCEVSGLNLGTPTTSDNCGVSSVTNDAPNTFEIGNTLVTWTVTDNSGNTASVTQTVTVSDNSNPSITAPANITTSANSDCNATGVILGTPIVSDNCEIASVTNNAPGIFPVGSTSVIWTVIDNAGHSSTSVQTVTVVDNQNPTITAPLNITTTTNNACSATALELGTPVTNDNCGIASVSNDAPSTYPLGTTTITWMVTDVSGNSASTTQTVTVTDEELPVIIAPPNITDTVDGNCEVTGIDLGIPTTSDNCGIASVSNDAPSTFALGTTTITWTITDNSGNTATSTQNIIVVDTENPLLTAPSDITLYPTLTCDTSGVNLGTPLTSDNCGIASISNDGPSTFVFGTTTVTWTVTDNSGNTTTAAQIVTVVDVQAPVIDEMDTLFLSTNSSCTYTGLVLDNPTVTDNCGIYSIVNNAPPTLNIGTTTISWTVVDNSGNAASANQIVVVTDNEVPVIINCNDTINSCESVVSFELPNAVDNCSIASFQQVSGLEYTSGSLFPDGMTVLNYEAIDVAGNIATCAVVVNKIILPGEPNAGDDQTVYIETTTLQAQVDPIGEGSWSIVEGHAKIADSDNANSYVTGLQRGVTILTWTLANEGCSSGSDTLKITFVDINIPNAFSPDGDNINDVFEIKGVDSYGPATMIVTNRWGEVVYKTEDYKNEWNASSVDGQNLSDDTYYYYLKLGNREEFSGFVIVKRK